MNLPVDQQRISPPAPALGLVICFALGIALDRSLTETFSGLTLGHLLLLQAVLFLIGVGLAIGQSARAASLVLLLLVVTTGAMWHHQFWQVAAVDHLRRYARQEAEPFDLQLVVLTEPQMIPPRLPRFASAWPQETKTRVVGEVEGLFVGEQFVPAQGRIQVTVACAGLPFQPGDRLRALGTVQQLTPPRNPASYDFASALRARQIAVTMFCDSPDSLRRETGQPSSFWWNVDRWLQRRREQIRQTFADSLSPESAALAEALILGERQNLTDDTQEIFQNSGLMHLLSISGLHVGLIGLLCFQLGRLLNVPPGKLTLLTGMGITLCLLLAEMRPPVLRAWIIGMVLIFGWWCKRPISFLQSLSLAAGLLLVINPAWLFDTGAQLSFLAMLGIYCVNLSVQHAQAAADKSAKWIDSNDNTLLQWSLTKSLLRKSGQALLLSGGITLLALPLLAFTFQRVTWAGIPATFVSLPLLYVSLGLLLPLALLGNFSSALATGLAWPVELVLGLQVWVAEQFSAVPLLGWNCIRPSLTALLLMYGAGLLGLCYQQQAQQQRSLAASKQQRWLNRPALWGAVWLILLLALFEGHRGRNFLLPPPLECRALSIGHGNACLLRCPNGKSVLLDAGSMENGLLAARVIQANLADLQAERLDAIVVSHTDTDHLNAIPFLLELIPVRDVFLNPIGLNPRHPGMRALTEAAFQKKIRLTILQPHDRLTLDRGIELQVLQALSHPGEGTGNDNADSLVLELQAYGRRVLFPGDVSGSGQENLIKMPHRHYDVILAPHHGGRKENTAAFAQWAGPQVVFVSAGNRENADFLEQTYGVKTPLLFTSEGALRFQIEPAGELKISQWDRQQYWQNRLVKPEGLPNGNRPE